jgi:hypothetical protein
MAAARARSPGRASASASAAASAAASPTYVSLNRWIDSVNANKAYYIPGIQKDAYAFFQVATFAELYALLDDIIVYKNSGMIIPKIEDVLNNINGNFSVFYGIKVNFPKKGDYTNGFSIKKLSDNSAFFELRVVSSEQIDVITETYGNVGPPTKTICSLRKPLPPGELSNGYNGIVDKTICTIAGGSRKRRSKKRRSKKRRALRKTR